MLPKHHFILSIFFGFLVFLIYPQMGLIGAFLIALSGILIDFDHYLAYLLEKKNFSLKNSYSWWKEHRTKYLSLTREKRNNYYVLFYFLHGFELVIILYIFGIYFSNYFIFIASGIAFHLLLDITFEQTSRDRVDKFSLIYDYFKFKKLKKLT